MKQTHLDDLKKSGLTADHAQKLHMKSLAEDRYRIPYFSADGKETDFYRDKFLHKEEYLAKLKKAKKKAPPKYTQSTGTEPHIYLPPLLKEKWRTLLDNPTTPLVLTEGEKKSACACAHGIPCAGLGGTWNWRSRKLAMQILPELNRVAWKGRPVRVVLDSDCLDNDQARKGGEWFVAELNKRGAEATLVILPPDPDSEAKVALDDHIVKYGAEATMKLLAEPTSVQAEPWLEELNSKIAVIVDTGEFVALDTGNVYGNTAIRNVYGKYGSLTKWTSWPRRRQVQRLVFEPGSPSGVTPEGEYNTWRGWNVEPVKCKVKDVQPWLDLVARVLPEATEAERYWANCWFGYPIAHPGQKLNTAMLVWSTEHGTGKNALGVTMKHVYGLAWGKVDGTELAGPFNEWAINKQFVVADELKIGDKRGLTNKLKEMITRGELRVNSKNQKTYVVRDHINYYLTSNHPDAMYIETRDRRMAVYHASEERLPPDEWRKYEKWLKCGGAAKLRYYFAHLLDYSVFDPQAAAPVTKAKLEMTAAGRSVAEDWIAKLKENPDSVLKTQYDLYRATDLYKAFDPDGRENIKPIGFATKLGEAGLPRISHNNTVIDGLRAWLWVVRGDSKVYQRMTPTQLAAAYVAERPTPTVGANGKYRGKVQ